MAKAKRGPALFELLGDEGSATGGVKVPSWWSRHTQLTDLHAARAARAAAEPPPAFEESPRSTGDRSPLRPLFEVEGDRVLLSLTSVTAAVAVFLGLAMVLAAFGLGARRGDVGGFRRGFDAGRADVASATGDEIVALRNQPPASHLVGGLLQETGAKPTSSGAREDRPAIKAAAAAPVNLPASAVPAAGWVRNLTYIVAQEFPAANVEKARHAREFLAQRGVNTELVPLNTDTTLLIATQGYSHKDPAQKRLAEQLLEKVRTIGTQYYAAGG
ncbi:MAG: hypothetical protein AAB385_00995, partial [Planctomycetota bacterium]